MEDEVKSMSETILGQTVSAIPLLNQEGKEVSLTDFKGKNIVLYFYPKDMTPGCTTESCDFRDFHLKFGELNSVVIGVSPDDIKSHQKFINKHDLPFTLLADTEQALAKHFDVWKLKKNFGKEYMGIERSTFVINEQGEIVNEWRKVSVKNHVQEVLDYIKEM